MARAEISTTAVTVDTSAVLLYKADNDGEAITILNRGPASIFLGASDVTTADGLDLASGAGGVRTLGAGQEIYAISGAAGNTVIVST